MSGEELSSEQMIAEVQSPASPEAAVETPVEAPKAPWEEDEYTIEGGKLIKEPREMILKRAGMGYHYAQKMHALTQKEQSLATIEARNKELAKWEEFDKYATENPQWMSHVEQAWQARQTLGQSNEEPVNPVISQLQQQLEELKGQIVPKLSQWEAQQNEIKFEAEDKQFDEEIGSVGQKFGVDLAQADEQGRTLEWRVLEHMKEMGLNANKPGHFTAAFKDYYFDNLMDRQKEEVKEKHAKSEQELKKNGILGVSRTPKSGSQSFNGSDKNLSWDQLRDRALAEYRAGK